ncbi:MAG: hypothetical protein DPW18_14935 [Chloroflexi bacterium]|nr:hypothetical protein [Chloroflexota bacterium]MDL1942276.1 DinB family protein [Chloroflexi bacterium CFX2]
MKTSISTACTSANIERVVRLLAETPVRLEALGEPLPAQELRRPLGEGERSFMETLVHLLNSEARTSEAIHLALLLDEPLVADIHPERDWGKLVRLDLLEFAELLAYFKTRRRALLRVLSALTEAQWVRSVRESGKRRKESVYWKARSLALHESEHLEDLEIKLG